MYEGLKVLLRVNKKKENYYERISIGINGKMIKSLIDNISRLEDRLLSVLLISQPEGKEIESINDDIRIQSEKIQGIMDRLEL